MTGDKGALMETTTFTALCERAGRWWTIRIPQLEGLTARSRTLDQVEIMSRQAEGYPFPGAATMLALTPAEIEVFAPVTGAASAVEASTGPLHMTGQ